MKISVITITCRQNPRLEEVARTLLASLARATGDVELEWVIVDELDRSPLELIGADDSRPPNWSAVVINPPRSSFRSGADKTPAHNTARNAGLAFVFDDLTPPSDYIVFLNDCNLVTPEWVAVARDCAASGVGWKCKAHVRFDVKVPDNGILHMGDHHDLLRPVPPKTVAGPCWGAPAFAFEEIYGFDTAYDGEKKGAAIDAVLRIARLGLAFITTERAYTIQLRLTRIASEITTSKEATADARNQKFLNELHHDKDRIMPRAHREYSEPAAPLAPVVPAGAVASPVAGVLIRRTGNQEPAGAARQPDDAAPVKVALPPLGPVIAQAFDESDSDSDLLDDLT